MRRALTIAAVVASCLAPAALASGSEREAPSEATLAAPALPQEYFVETHDGFEVAYHPAARASVRELAPRLTEIRAELRRELGAPVLERVELRVASLPIEVPRLSPGAAVTFHGGASFEDHALVVVSVGGVEAAGDTLESSLRHHLAHLALAEAAGEALLPAWFEEGFAVHFAGTRQLGRFGELELATLAGRGPSLAELEAGTAPGDAAAWVAQHAQTLREQALSADFARYAGARGATAAILQSVRDGHPFEASLEAAFGADRAAIELAWRRDATRRYAVLPLVALAILLLSLGLLVRALKRRAPLRRKSATRVIHRRTRGVPRRRETKLRVPAYVADHELPRVEHDGGWHTLH